MHTNAHNDEEKRAGRGRRHRHGEECTGGGMQMKKKIEKRDSRHASSAAKTHHFRCACERERDGLEDATDRGALDKRGDTGLIAAFTLTAHQSRSTASRTSFPFSSSRFACVFVDM